MIIHITSHADWRQAQLVGVYRAESLEREGFIHCSTPAQLLATAERYYRGVAGLALLVIDPDRLAARLVYEDSYGAGQEYPHLYGPLNLDAVVQVHDFPPGPDGHFALPAGLSV